MRVVFYVYFECEDKRRYYCSYNLCPVPKEATVMGNSLDEMCLQGFMGCIHLFVLILLPSFPAGASPGGSRPCPSSLVPLFQNESKCETIQMKMSLICMKMNLQAELIFI